MKRTLIALGIVAALLIGSAAKEATAAYSVFKYNLNPGWGGWYRTDTAGGVGFYPSVNTTSTNCINSIRQRLADNAKYRQQYDVYIIVYSPQNVPSGALRQTAGMQFYGYYGSVTFGPHARMGRY